MFFTVPSVSHHVCLNPDRIRFMYNTSSTEFVFEIFSERAQCAGAPHHVSLVHFKAGAPPHPHTAGKGDRGEGESAGDRVAWIL